VQLTLHIDQFREEFSCSSSCSCSIVWDCADPGTDGLAMSTGKHTRQRSGGSFRVEHEHDLVAAKPPLCTFDLVVQIYCKSRAVVWAWKTQNSAEMLPRRVLSN